MLFEPVIEKHPILLPNETMAPGGGAVRQLRSTKGPHVLPSRWSEDTAPLDRCIERKRFLVD